MDELFYLNDDDSTDNILHPYGIRVINTLKRNSRISWIIETITDWITTVGKPSGCGIPYIH